ncbi:MULTISPECIES: hypothetical protein [unclassified Erythrobacter]|jgi:hypothetical protein|uniref:hypothetical protein n=1 Tax=Erythrobacteraceae TaxID=335929 RepID=UPI00076DAE04|nr:MULTISPECIES: hypothetical protein [unclassified Erythrobacter]KWV93701.1 hypothetical protein ASS64_12440 [Erythrobacter sp. AP23]MBO6767519.1 hypothetical protein [Erythrobacter sp.]
MAKLGLTDEDKPNHLTDAVGKKLERATDDLPGQDDPVPGPSPNPATNLIIHDIMLRSAGRLSRMAVEKAVLGRQYGQQFAKDAVENRSLVHTLAAYGVTKVATKSVPGALLVGTGLVLKVLFDRSQSRRKSRRRGNRTLQRQADPDGEI